MDIVRLNDDTYVPELLIENLNSTMWTERVVEPGDFEIKTHDIRYGLNYLPANALVSHLKTGEVGIVESQVLSKDVDGVPELTISGRTFDSFLENRVLVGDLTLAGDPPAPAAGEEQEEPKEESKFLMLQQYTPEEVAALLIWNTVVHVNPVITGVSRAGKRTYSGNPLDALDRVKVTMSGSFFGENRSWWMELGTLAERVIGVLQDGDLGIRTIRPGYGPMPRNASVFTVTDGGTPQRETYSDLNDLRFDIYQGTNRTLAAEGNDAVVFDYTTGDFDEPQYLFSRKGYKNIEVVDSLALGAELVGSNSGSLTTKGLSRRVGYGKADTERGKRNLSSYRAALIQEGRRRLRSQRPQAVIDAEISPDANYTYGQDYFIGDYVTMRGDYGLVQTMRVTEFIRTEDPENGEQGYPTLTALE